MTVNKEFNLELSVKFYSLRNNWKNETRGRQISSSNLNYFSFGIM